jgi:hypothetical protein
MHTQTHTHIHTHTRARARTTGIAFYDFISVNDGLIYPGEGAAHHLCKFRFVFFRPFVGEVIDGIIEESSERGLRVSLSFFDDIWIPRDCLMGDARYHRALNCFFARTLVKDDGEPMEEGEGGAAAPSAAATASSSSTEGQGQDQDLPSEGDDVYWYHNKAKLRFKVTKKRHDMTWQG